MHKTGLNAKPQGWITWFHSAKSTVYNRYHRSREWFIRSAGAYNEGWRGEGSGGQDTRQSGNIVMIWFYSSVDEWCQSRGAANSSLISRSDQQLAWLHSLGAALRLARLHHHTHKSGFALNKCILSHTSVTKLTVFVCVSIHPEHQEDKRKLGLAAVCSNRGYRCENILIRREQHGLHFQQNPRCCSSPWRNTTMKQLSDLASVLQINCCKMEMNTNCRHTYSMFLHFAWLPLHQSLFCFLVLQPHITLENCKSLECVTPTCDEADFSQLSESHYFSSTTLTKKTFNCL